MERVVSPMEEMDGVCAPPPAPFRQFQHVMWMV